MLKIVRGNLLDAQVDALVNTVNTVGVMGKGIALQFKKAFPDNFKAYELACKKNLLTPGGVLVYQVGGITKPRYIINLATKKHWRGKSNIGYVKTGIKKLLIEIRRLNIQSVAIPPLGCGNGGLEWGEVLPMIEATFSELPDIEVLVFEPAGAPRPEAMLNRTNIPNMTSGRAAVLALMRRYKVPGYDYRLSLLEVQKLAYFLQESGEPLNLIYQPHHYGPYADSLRHVLNRLEGHYIIGFGDGRNSPETPIRLLSSVTKDIDSFLQDKPETIKRLNNVSKIIEGYETSYGMELLATVHWVAKHNNKAKIEERAAINAVHKWNSRKALIPATHITTAWRHLQTHHWI